MKMKSFLTAVMLITALASCSHDPVGISEMDQVCFETEVLPIYKNNCTMSNCHNAEAQKAGYNFEDYEHIMEGITPYDPKASKAFTLLSNSWNIMPPGNPLPATSRNIILVWIEQGANNTTCSDTLNGK